MSNGQVVNGVGQGASTKNKLDRMNSTEAKHHIPIDPLPFLSD